MAKQTGNTAASPDHAVRHGVVRGSFYLAPRQAVYVRAMAQALEIGESEAVRRLLDEAIEAREQKKSSWGPSESLTPAAPRPRSKNHRRSLAADGRQ